MQHVDVYLHTEQQRERIARVKKWEHSTRRKVKGVGMSGNRQHSN